MERSAARLRLAVLCQAPTLERWQARCVDHLQQTEGVELVAVIVASARARETSGPAPVGLYARRAALRRVPSAVALSSAAPGIPRIDIDPPRGGTGILVENDLPALRELDLDILLTLGVDPLFGPILDIPRYGVWIFDFDRCWTERVGFGELRRVVADEPVAELSLLRLTSADNLAVVLRRGCFRTDQRSPSRGIVQARDEAAKWPAWVCTTMKRGDSRGVEGPVVPVRPAGEPVPGPAEMVHLAVIMVRNRLRFAWSRLFRHPQWNIGIVEQPIHALLHAEAHPAVRWFPLEGRRAFLADPFGQGRGANATILCEYFEYRRGKGIICSIDVSSGDFTSAPQPVLELDVHASYPCLVEHEGTSYCIPEAHLTREVSLFKADPFPRRWTKVATLLADVSIMDPTVFRHADRWWLMGSDGDSGGDVSLLAWYARRLEGPWIAHAANPLKIDVRSSRPGGTPFECEGGLYRPAQDCSRTYGGRIVINRVTQLTPEEFAEETVATIEPMRDDPYPAGRHTLSAFEDKTLIDGHRFVFVGTAFGHFVRIWARDLVNAATGRRRQGPVAAAGAKVDR